MLILAFLKIKLSVIMVSFIILSALILNVIMLPVTVILLAQGHYVAYSKFYCYAQCHFAEFRYAECRYAAYNIP